MRSVKMNQGRNQAERLLVEIISIYTAEAHKKSGMENRIKQREKHTKKRHGPLREGEERSSARENLSPSHPLETEEGKRAVDQSQTGDLRAEPGAKYECAGGLHGHGLQ